MREQAAPCVNATLNESLAGRHRTWNDDRVCDRCARAPHPCGARGPEVSATSGRERGTASVSASPASSGLSVSSQHGTAPARGQVGSLMTRRALKALGRVTST